MIELTQNMSGSNCIAAINTNLQEIGSSVQVSNTDASTLCAVLNNVFAEYDDITQLLDDMSGSEFVEAVNDNFATAALGVEYSGIKLLHTSDTHGYTTSLDKAIDIMSAQGNDVDFLVISGDMTQYYANIYTNDTKTAINAVKAMGDKLLMCPGNHDTYDNSHSGFGNSKADQVSETAWLKSCMGNNVTWDDQNNVGGYWYKDVVKDGHTLRIISIDQYCIGSTVYTGNNRYSTVYSQAEVDWLLNLLYNTPNSYYIVILLHEPPVQSPAGSGEDTAATGMAGENLFVSDCLATFGNRRNETDLNLLPKIMRAYMHQENLSFSYSNYADRGGHGTLTVAKDFRSHTPATFLCYIGGHMHEDICGYIPYTDWSDQLMIFVTAGDSSVIYSSQDDLLWNYNSGNFSAQRYAQDEPSYRLNEVTIDFERERIKVERVGNKTTAPKDSTNGADRPHGIRVRSSITFPFKKGGAT